MSVILDARQLPPDELERRMKILAELWGSWSAEDEEAFRHNRTLWATWQPRSSKLIRTSFYLRTQQYPDSTNLRARAGLHVLEVGGGPG